MVGSIGPSNEIIPDSRTGESSKLETGERRKHNMPGEKACDKYTGKEKQDCLDYKGRFAKMAKTQKPSSSTTEEMNVREKDRAIAANAQMKKRFKKKGIPYYGR